MLQQLTVATGAEAWAIGSLLFFVAVFLLVLYRVLSGKREQFEIYARMPLDDAPAAGSAPATAGAHTASTGADQPTEQGA